MLKYSRIINKETKQCEVGLGTNSKFYESIGMTEMSVEQAYDGKWYVEGYAPEKPQEVIDKERIAKLEEYLSKTDWYAIRKADNGEDMPEEIRTARQDARDEISRLRGE
jgi:hypothetical protein